MTISEWIAIAGLFFLYGSSILAFWINTKVKLKELEIKISTLNDKVNEHIRWGEAEQEKNELKFEQIQGDLKECYKELTAKMDIMIDKFGDFQVYCEKNFKK